MSLDDLIQEVIHPRLKVDEVKEWVKKYSDDVLGFEFWVGDEYEYWNIGVEK